jgi:fucose 4-O-acetylase-like acetyltransferase
MVSVQDEIVKQVPTEAPPFRAAPTAISRLAWIDLARGIGIALVVIGHACADGDSIPAYWTRDTIYLFHMPLFFIVSGYLAKPGPVLPYIRQRFNALIVPYICYLLVIGIPLAAQTHQLHHRSATVEFALYLYGGKHLVTYMTVFWFVTCLFFAQNIYRAMQRLSSSPYDIRIVAIVALCAAFSYGFLSRHEVMTPLALAEVPMAVVLLWFGQVYKSLENRSGVVVTMCLAAMAALAFYLHDFPLYEFNIKGGQYGPLVPGLTTAVALSWLLFEACKRLASSKLLLACIAPFGQASLTIMFLSEPVRRLALQAGWSDAAAIVAALVLPLAIHKLFEKNGVLARLFLGQRMRLAGGPPVLT